MTSCEEIAPRRFEAVLAHGDGHRTGAASLPSEAEGGRRAAAAFNEVHQLATAANVAC